MYKWRQESRGCSRQKKKKIDWVEKWKKVHTPWQEEALSGEDNTELLLFQWPLNLNLCHGISKLVHCWSVIHVHATCNTYRHISSCHSFLFWTCLFSYFCPHLLTLFIAQYRLSWCVLRHVFIKSSWVPYTTTKTTRTGSGEVVSDGKRSSK